MSPEWRAGAVVPDGTRPTPDEWEPVSVPGRPAQFADAEAVAYETTFDDPRAGSDEHAILVLEGAYAHTRVWCNGEPVAEHDTYTAPLRVRLPDADQYRVAVECRAPADRFGGLHDTDALPPERCVPGIWWRTGVETRPDPYVRSLATGARLTETGAAVDVTAEVVSQEPIDDRLTVSIRPTGSVRGGGMMDRTRVDADAGPTTVTHTIEVRDPSLWWPHDRGDQSLYVVSAKLGESEATVRTGIRAVTDGADGLEINGEPLRARGVTLLDPTSADIERALKVNANLVRVRAQGVPPAVARTCDQQGLLLWQDLPLTGRGEFDTERGREVATATRDAVGHHPCLALVGVHDEPVGRYADRLGAGRLDRLRYRFRAWRASYDDSGAEAVAEQFDDVPTVPVVGPPGIDADAVTLYPGWEYGRPGDVAWLSDRYGLGDAVGGFGAGAPGAEPSADDDPADRGSEAYQARVVRTVAEWLRRDAREVVVVDSLRDTGSGSGKGVLAADGTKKQAYDALRDSFQPTQAVLADPTPGESDVVVCHDRGAGATVTVEWDHNGEREQAQHVIEEFGRATVGSLTLEAGDELTLAAAVEGRAVKNEYRI